CEQQVVRIQHDADHPGEALQALESQTVYGLSFLLVMAEGTGWSTGFGVTSADLSQDGIMMALEMAQHSTAPEPFRLSLPRPVDLAPPPTPLYDPQVLTLPDDDIRQAALEALDGALSTLQEAGHARGLVVRGEVRSQKEHLVI